MFPTLIQYSFGIPTQATRQEQEIKMIQIGKKEVKLYLFADNMILYPNDPKKLYQKILRNRNTF
jgi:hypothetical protein